MPAFKRFRLPRLWGRRPGRLELIEDALKHVHAALERGQQATVESLAGALGISSARATELTRDLHVRGLVTTEEGLTLTPAGQEWARTVVRAHRLLERYLADEVRVPPAALHRLADQKEHRLDRAEVERLAARLGYPQRDPHGDPIPTAEGELATLAAIPVTLAPLREPLRVVHVEDEPEAVYAQLAALDLEPDRVLVVLDFSPERLILDIEGVRHELRPVDAANIFVAPAPAGAPGPAVSLADLELGEAARVKALRVSGLARRRLLDLGFTRGARVECALRSPSGEPKAYRIRGTLVALRSGQARRIEIEREEATPEP
jgi:DtxR family Mn-dependent transcriptional regulator